MRRVLPAWWACRPTAAGILGIGAPAEPSSSAPRQLGRAAGPPVQAEPGRVPGPPPDDGQEGQAAPAQLKADVEHSGSLAFHLDRRPPANGHSSRSQGWVRFRTNPAGKPAHWIGGPVLL